MRHYQADRKYLFIQYIVNEPAGEPVHLKGNLLTAMPEEAPWLFKAKSIRIIELTCVGTANARDIELSPTARDMTFFKDHRQFSWATMPAQFGNEARRINEDNYDRFVVPKGFGHFQEDTYVKYPFTDLAVVEDRLSSVIRSQTLPIHVTRSAAELQTTIHELTRYRTFVHSNGWCAGEIKLEQPA